MKTEHDYKVRKRNIYIILNIVLVLIHIILIFTEIQLVKVKRRNIRSNLENISLNIQSYIDSSEYDKAMLEINKMEILEELPDTEKAIWIKNRDYYLELINNSK